MDRIVGSIAKGPIHRPLETTRGQWLHMTFNFFVIMSILSMLSNPLLMTPFTSYFVPNVGSKRSDYPVLACLVGG